VQTRGACSRVSEVLRDFRDGNFLVAENQSGLVRMLREHVIQRTELVVLLGREHPLTDLGDCFGRLVDRDAHRLALVRPTHLLDRVRERGGEERSLKRSRQSAQDLVHFFGEAHVEHAIRLVEHRCDEAAELERAATEVIEHASGRSHGNMNPTLQRRELRTQGLPAGNHQHVEPRVLAPELANLAGHLGTQLTGRAEDEGLKHAPVQRQVLENRQGIRGGFATPGFRLTDQVLPGEQHRNGRGLDRGHLLVAEFMDHRQQRGRQVERSKAGGHARKDTLECHRVRQMTLGCGAVDAAGAGVDLGR